MEVDMDSSPASSSASSPLLTPQTTPTTQRVLANASLSLSQPSSECPSPVSVFDTLTVLPSQASISFMSTFLQTQHSPFNSFPAYFDYGAITSPLQASREITSASSRQPYSCVFPILQYSPSSVTSANTPSSSRVASPVAAQGQTQASFHPPSQFSSHISANDLPSNAVLAQINDAPPQQSSQITQLPTQQPIEPNKLPGSSEDRFKSNSMQFTRSRGLGLLNVTLLSMAGILTSGRCTEQCSRGTVLNRYV